MLYIYNGYASLGTNDDWALRGMLVNKGVYGTLIMSCPLSFIVSHLYDIFPSFQWYSILLFIIISINFYLFALYIEKNNSKIQKFFLLVLAFLWLTFLWFNTSITALTVLTVISAIGLIKANKSLSFLLLFIAFLLRSDIMFVFLPFYAVAYCILSDKLLPNKKELTGAIILVVLIGLSVTIQKQDRPYIDWLAFNKARSAIQDMNTIKTQKDFFTPMERIYIAAGWWQDEKLFPTQKVIAISPTLSEILQKNIHSIDLIAWLKTYKFKHWLWLLLFGSSLLVIFNITNKKSICIILLLAGVVLLLITRDVERVTVGLMVLWAYVLFESLKRYKNLRLVFLTLFTGIFYYYLSGQLGYRYFNENTRLLKEAHDLINRNNKVCEPSINFPTGFSNEVNMLFRANYLFHENDWMQIGDNEILPTGWMARHPFFYQSHNISDRYKKRKYNNYYEYLTDDHTAFIGSKWLEKSKPFRLLLKEYDKLYLKDRPECETKTIILDQSEHFSISQIKIICKND